MNSDYISRALCFHGQPMQKIWEDERGAGDLQRWGVPQHCNYTVYLERQKFFTFQDRAKRLKLHQFFSRKAMDLYDRRINVVGKNGKYDRKAIMDKARPYIATVPPFEIFVNKQQEKFKRLRCLLESLKPGDVIYGMKSKNQLNMLQAPLMVKPLCTAEPLVRYLRDITIKSCVQQAGIKYPTDKDGKPRSFNVSEYVCCEVVDVSVDADRLNLTMESSLSKNENVKFGLVSADDLPEYYRAANAYVDENNKYKDCLIKTKQFLNPNYDVLYEINGIDVNDTFSLMHCLKQPLPLQEYAKELRQAQASKWAFRSVAEGIEHFKIGRHVEAFQCLNKALNIDPRNVEGLVARGALYANKGSFLKAVDDFEKALKLNSFHVNARKYMGETLVALGRSYEEDNRIKDALKAYRDCLNIIPNHEQARLSLETLQQRPENQLFDNLLNIPGTGDLDLKVRRKQTSASSSGSSGSSGSGSDTDSDTSEKTRNHSKKELSLSPLSKRIAQHVAVTTTSTQSSSGRGQFSQPFYMANQSNTTNNILRNPNEFRLEDDDTDERVRKLLEEASKYKKEKTKKSKKKKSKKSKKVARKDKSAAALLNNLDKIDFKDAFQVISGFKDESKLNENLQLYERTIAQIKKRQEILDQSTSATNRLSNDGNRRGADSPPPAPSMSISEEEQVPPPPPSIKINTSTTAMYSSTNVSSYSTASKSQAPQTRFSFTIKRPVKIDKFGLVRIATPLANQANSSPTRSRSRSRSASRTQQYNRQHSPSRSDHTRSRDDAHYRARRSRSRSKSFERHSRRHLSRSRSRGRLNRSRSRSRSERVRVRRRTPSPFVPRGTPSPRRNSRTSTRSPRRKGKSARKNFANRVWQRPGYTPGVEAGAKADRWLHDKFNEKSDEGPTIEEIDEIINKAQKERKEEIIKRDKGILKKSI